jgi:hypothetical protein
VKSIQLRIKFVGFALTFQPGARGCNYHKLCVSRRHDRIATGERPYLCIYARRGRYPSLAQRWLTVLSGSTAISRARRDGRSSRMGVFVRGERVWELLLLHGVCERIDVGSELPIFWVSCCSPQATDFVNPVGVFGREFEPPTLARSLWRVRVARGHIVDSIERVTQGCPRGRWLYWVRSAGSNGYRIPVVDTDGFTGGGVVSYQTGSFLQESYRRIHRDAAHRRPMRT